MKGRAGDRKRSPANRSLFGPVDHNQNKLDVNRIWTRLNERARTRVVDPTTEDLDSGTRGELAGVGSTDEEEGSGGGGVDDVRTRTREVSPSSELLRISPGADGQEFVLRSGTPDDGCRERGPQSSAESLISRRLVGSKPTCVTMRNDSMRPDTSSSPSSSSPSSITNTATSTSSATTSVLKSSDCPWRAPVNHRRWNEAPPPLQRPSLPSPDVESWRGELHRRPLRSPPPPAEESEFRRIPVVQLVAGGDGVCPQEAQRQKKCFFKPIRASTARRSSEDDDDDEEEGGSRDDDDGPPATEMTPNRKRKKEGGDGGDDDSDDDGRASCWVQSAVRSGSEMFGEPGIKSEILNRRLNEIAIPKKR